MYQPKCFFPSILQLGKTSFLQKFCFKNTPQKRLIGNLYTTSRMHRINNCDFCLHSYLRLSTDKEPDCEYKSSGDMMNNTWKASQQFSLKHESPKSIRSYMFFHFPLSLQTEKQIMYHQVLSGVIRMSLHCYVLPLRGEP